MRIDKFLSNLKYGSRAEIKKFIKNKEIFVNNELVTSSSLIINPIIDKVIINNNLVFYKVEINLMINKPVGYLSANTDKLHQTIFDLIKEPYNRFDLKIAGRLDLDSSGLLLLTTNGEFAHRITNPNYGIAKVYEVVLKDKITSYKKLLDGIIIKDGNNNDYLAKALNIDIINEFKLLITIDEGKFHQVRRMFKYLGNEVLELKRIQVGNLELKNLEVGQYKEFESSDLL